MSDVKMSDWHNAKAEIIFTVGVHSSASVGRISEKYADGESCDSVYQDLVEEGATTFLECIGIDTSKEGTFIAQVLVKCNYDESPDYKLESVVPYDSNQELIASLKKDAELAKDRAGKARKEEQNKWMPICDKQAAQIKQLREVLVYVATLADASLEDEADEIARKALDATTKE